MLSCLQEVITWLCNEKAVCVPDSSALTTHLTQAARASLTLSTGRRLSAIRTSPCMTGATKATCSTTTSPPRLFTTLQTTPRLSHLPCSPATWMSSLTPLMSLSCWNHSQWPLCSTWYVCHCVCIACFTTVRSGSRCSYHSNVWGILCAAFSEAILIYMTLPHLTHRTSLRTPISTLYGRCQPRTTSTTRASSPCCSSTTRTTRSEQVNAQAYIELS